MKNHQLTTTKERQIDFMWHLYGQGFTQKEIAAVYNTTHHKVCTALKNKGKKQAS